MRSSGNGNRVEKVRREKAVHRADLDERSLAHDAERAAARERPGRVGVQTVGGLGEVEREALCEEQEAVEEAARQQHVVVDEQPASRGLLLKTHPPHPRAAG